MVSHTWHTKIQRQGQLENVLAQQLGQLPREAIALDVLQIHRQSRNGRSTAFTSGGFCRLARSVVIFKKRPRRGRVPIAWTGTPDCSLASNSRRRIEAGNQE